MSTDGPLRFGSAAGKPGFERRRNVYAPPTATISALGFPHSGKPTFQELAPKIHETALYWAHFVGGVTRGDS